MSKPLKTAAELMAELRANPDFCKREQEKEERLRRREEQYSQLKAPFLERLSAVGFPGSSFEEIVQKYAPLSTDAVEILLSAFSELGDPRLKESAVRALAAARQPFDGRKLVTCFERADDEGLRWAILNTIAIATPHSIDDWLSAIQDTPTGKTLRKLSVRE